MNSREERLAEALMVERIHGDHAAEIVNERVNTLLDAEDWAGVKRWLEIGDWLHQLRRTGGKTH